MIKQAFILTDENGFHAKPANDLVYVANQYLDCALFAEHNGRRVTLHSILGVLSLKVRPGDEVILSAEGDQEEAAMIALQEVIVNSSIGTLKE